MPVCRKHPFHCNIASQSAILPGEGERCKPSLSPQFSMDLSFFFFCINQVVCRRLRDNKLNKLNSDLNCLLLL